MTLNRALWIALWIVPAAILALVAFYSPHVADLFPTTVQPALRDDLARIRPALVVLCFGGGIALTWANTRLA